MNQIDKIIEYEQNNLNRNQIIELFQELLDDGVLFKLQGSYGRFGAKLLAEGHIVNRTGVVI